LNELEGKIVSERSLVLVKPDGVKRGLIGEVLKRIETKGWKIVALELRKLDEKTAASHYAEHDGKPFFKDLISFITSSPLLAVVIEGPNAIAGWQQIRQMLCQEPSGVTLQLKLRTTLLTVLTLLSQLHERSHSSFQA
jgi:nucleoside diphosphate kinase